MTYAHIRSTPTKRKPVNLSLSQDLVDEAKLSGINISAVAKAAELAAVSRFIQEEGLPLANLRLW